MSWTCAGKWERRVNGDEAEVAVTLEGVFCSVVSGVCFYEMFIIS